MHMFLDIWHQVLFPGDLRDATLLNFCTIESNCLTQSTTLSTLEQLPVYFYLITWRIQLDCFDRSVYSQCALCNKTWLKFRKAFCLF